MPRTECAYALIVAGLTLLAGWGSLQAEIEVVQESEIPLVFSETKTTIHVLFHNPGTHPVDVPLRTRLMQESASILLPIGEAQPWKTIQIRPGETIQESVD